MILNKKDSKELSLKMMPLSTSKNTNNKNNVEENSNQVNVTITYAYINDSYTYDEIPVILVNNDTLLLNDIIDTLAKKGCNLSGTSISYFDSELNSFINCGIFPFSGNVLVPFEQIENEIPNIKIKSRVIIKKDTLMRMELSEENSEQIDESNQNVFINVKSKRSKERKIGYIIEKVFLWRKLYNGFVDDNGSLVKLTLEEAAEKVGISKKSLDDYLIQLRIGKQHGFVFNEHKNDKVGVLRAFVKKHKYEESKGTLNLGNPYSYQNLTFHGNYSSENK